MGLPGRHTKFATLALGLGAVLVSATLVSACAVPVVEGLEEHAASEVVVALSEQAIGASKEKDPSAEGRFRVSVATDDVAVALSALNNLGLPVRAAPGVLASLGESSLVPSRSAERARFLAGTAGELEQSLRQISGVLGARVHLAAPERDPLSEAAVPASGSVLLRHSGATPPVSADDVRRLVAGAVSGLRPEAVAVVMQPIVSPALNASVQLTQLGPLSVARSSANPLRIGFAAVAALNLCLVVGLLFLWARLRKLLRAGNRAKANESET